MEVSSVTGTGSANGFDTEGRHAVASYRTYAEAEYAVDHLSDVSFPIQSIEIVGRDLRLVERVTGRMTNARAAAFGAGAGAWFGLFIGLLVGLFTPAPVWLGLILGGVLIGAFWGAVFGLVTHGAMRGRRDFSSTRRLVAGRYDVTAAAAQAELAARLLAGSPRPQVR